MIFFYTFFFNRISQLPVRRSPQVKKLFQDLVNKITPGPLTSFVLSTPDEIDPSFYEQKKNPLEQPEDVRRSAVFDFTTGSLRI